MQKAMVRLTLLTVMVIGLLPAAPAAAQPIPQDVVTVGAGSGPPGGSVFVPVFIRDTSGTPLGIDQPPGSRIQSYSLKVDYSPASAVQSVTFTRAGITSTLTPAFESSPSSLGSITLIDTFQESTNLIPFTSNAPLPGNQVANLAFNIAPSATPGTIITLTLDPALTQLTDQAGSGSTKESTTNGNLLLVPGAVTVTTPVPALSTWMLMLLAGSLAFIAIRTRL
jgi:hypothetical protein